MPLPLQVLMPMAGRGERFQLPGQPRRLKPLLELDGQSFVSFSLSSLCPLHSHETYEQRELFVIRAVDDEDKAFSNHLASLSNNAEILRLEEMTRGAAETCYMAREMMNPEAPLMLLDCDMYFESEDFLKALWSCCQGNFDAEGLLLTFEADKPRYSYAELDKDGVVQRTAEKEVISNHALAGAYVFAKARYFLETAAQLLAEGLEVHPRELYSSYLFNLLLQRGYKVRSVPSTLHLSYGTPAEWEQCQSFLSTRKLTPV